MKRAESGDCGLAVVSLHPGLWRPEVVEGDEGVDDGEGVFGLLSLVLGKAKEDSLACKNINIENHIIVIL